MNYAESLPDVYSFKFLFFIIKEFLFYGCATWSLTLREEHRLRVFENRLLRRILGPKRDGVTGGWRKLHNEELHNLSSSPSIIRLMKSRRMNWAGRVEYMVRRLMHIGFRYESQKDRDHYEDVDMIG
jgi:hypothetical protein